MFSLVGFLINASTFGALGGIMPHMVADLGWNWFEGGLGFTILGAACGSSSFIPTVLIRRFGVRATLSLGAVMMIAGFFCLAETHGAAVYFVGAALCGVGYQMMALIPGTHVLAAVFKHRALPFGIYFTIGSLGGVAGPVMVLALMHVFHDQWRVFWQAQMAARGLALVCTALVGGTAWLARPPRAPTPRWPPRSPRSARSRRLSHRRRLDDPPGPGDTAVLHPPGRLFRSSAHRGDGGVLSVGHLTERGVLAVVAGDDAQRRGPGPDRRARPGGLIGDRVDPRYLLLIALVALAAGSAALSVASDYPMMLLYAVGSGLGFGLALLAVTVLLLNYYGRKHNLEIFAVTCLIGAVSSLGPTIGGALRDLTGAFVSTFQLFAVVIGIILVAVLFMRPPRRTAAQDEAAARLARETA